MDKEYQEAKDKLPTLRTFDQSSKIPTSPPPHRSIPSSNNQDLSHPSGYGSFLSNVVEIGRRINATRPLPIMRPLYTPYGTSIIDAIDGNTTGLIDEEELLDEVERLRALHQQQIKNDTVALIRADLLQSTLQNNNTDQFKPPRLTNTDIINAQMAINTASMSPQAANAMKFDDDNNDDDDNNNNNNNDNANISNNTSFSEPIFTHTRFDLLNSDRSAVVYLNTNVSVYSFLFELLGNVECFPTLFRHGAFPWLPTSINDELYVDLTQRRQDDDDDEEDNDIFTSTMIIPPHHHPNQSPVNIYMRSSHLVDNDWVLVWGPGLNYTQECQDVNNHEPNSENVNDQKDNNLINKVLDIEEYILTNPYTTPLIAFLNSKAKFNPVRFVVSTRDFDLLLAQKEKQRPYEYQIQLKWEYPKNTK